MPFFYNSTNMNSEKNKTREIIKSAMMDISLCESFENLFNKKLSSLSNLNSNLKKKKIISYLLYRGWESNLIYSKANEI